MVSDTPQRIPDFPEFLPGEVWLVGAGPGDPGLLTLLGLHALAHADTVIYDALVGKDVLALANIDAELIHAGKRGGKPSPKQPDITQRIIERARAGNRVLRLKGGDPFVFGRGGEEALALAAAGVPFRVVPGITAGLGGLAAVGIPPTHRDSNSAIVLLTGHDASGATPQSIDWPAVARIPVIVLYMALKHLGEIADTLIAAGRSGDDPVALIQDATLANQRVVETTLAKAVTDAEAAGLAAPVIIAIGPVVSLRRTIAAAMISTGQRTDRAE